VLLVREDAGGITFDVLVTPRASREKVGPVHGDRLKVQVTAPPVDGEANEAVIQCLARELSVARSQIRIVAGETSRRKSVRIAEASARLLDRFR
jgi:uncharacterized protein (TIGR00251 family)